MILFYHTETLKRAGGENGGKEEAVFRDIFDGFLYAADCEGVITKRGMRVGKWAWTKRVVWGLNSQNERAR